MSRENAARRNRALRKIRASRHLPPEISHTLQVIIDLLSPKSGYSLAWPSAATLAAKTGKSRRTVLWHFAVIRQTGMFRIHQFSPQAAKDYARSAYDVEIQLNRCSAQAPNLFEVNAEHPIWNGSHFLPDEIDREWGEIAERVKAQRNARTTSALSTDPARLPRGQISDIRSTT